MKIGFWEIEKWEEGYLKSKLSEHDLVFFDGVLDKDNLPGDKSFDCLSVFTGCKLTKEVIDFFPSLKLITTRSTGFDHIDLKDAFDKGIVISSVPSYGENTVAEFAFGLLLTLTRKIYQASERVKKTNNFNVEGLQGVDLRGKVMGVVGTGRIGQHTITIANGFGMVVYGFDAYPKPELERSLNFKYLSFEQLLQSSDVISLHVPFLPQTQHMINLSNYRKIKKGAYLINTARGGVIETESLVKALDEGILAGAGLDVLEEEGCLQNEEDYLLKDGVEHNLKTVLVNHVLMKRDNVIVTPHNAFNTKEAVIRILDTTIENIKGFTEGLPKNVVKPENKEDKPKPQVIPFI